MSKQSEARSSARSAAKTAGGAHLTKQARLGTLSKLFGHLQGHGFQVSGMDCVREKHIAHYFLTRRSEGVSVRTLQNEAAHIRGAMRAVGRLQAAKSRTISNKALGIEGSSRAGTKTAATDEQYQAAIAKASELDAGLAAALKLQRTLGLRGAESVRCGPSLATWERQLSAGEGAAVIFGTKGGRNRVSNPAGRALALAAVREAKAVSDSRGGRLMDSPTLLAAMTSYRNAMHRNVTPASGICGHALRYAYAGDRMACYLAEGFSEAEARAKTSIDLGHGDGRGTYVARVYLR
ncbi:MAG: integrase domain-containing protein [Lysobacter sp.]